MYRRKRGSNKTKHWKKKKKKEEWFCQFKVRINKSKVITKKLGRECKNGSRGSKDVTGKIKPEERKEKEKKREKGK